jgi:hypothetical protein
MGVVMAKPPPAFIQETNELRKRATILLTYSLHLFFDDCRDLVERGIRPSIKQQLRSPLPVSEYGRQRQIAFNQWRGSARPLSFGDEQGTNYALLLSSLCETVEDNAANSCKVSETFTYLRLAGLMIKTVTDGGPVAAPVQKHGSFIEALRIAVTEIRSLFEIHDNDQEGVVQGLLAMTLKLLQIHFIPWHAPSRNSRYTRVLVSHRYWMTIDRTNPASSSSLQGSSSRLRINERRTRQVAAETVMTHLSSDWSVPETLSHMADYLDKTVLPVQWAIEFASLGRKTPPPDSLYVHETYKWVEENYRGNYWRHHMALVWSILVTAVLPRIYIPDAARAQVLPSHSGTEAMEIIRNWRWVGNPGTKKGLKQPEPFITMVTAYIMALLDQSSPLMVGFKKRKGLGNPWTSKHGMYRLSETIIRLMAGRRKICARCNSDAAWAGSCKDQWGSQDGYVRGKLGFEFESRAQGVI